MAEVTVRTAPGPSQGTLELADDVFGIQPNVPVMHQVVTAQLAARAPARIPPRPGPRCAAAGASRTSRRAPATPARARTAPQFSGGGIALAPSPAATPSGPPRRWCGWRCARPCRTGRPRAR